VTDAPDKALVERARAWLAYICASCGAPVALPGDVDTLDNGTALVCSECDRETVVDLDTPGQRAARYEAVARAYRAEADAGAMREALYGLSIAADNAPWVEDKVFDAMRRRVRALLLSSDAGKVALACMEAVRAREATMTAEDGDYDLLALRRADYDAHAAAVAALRDAGWSE